MSRPRLNNKERAKDAWSENQFKKGRPGNEKQWRAAAHDRFDSEVEEEISNNPYHNILGLKSAPKNIEELKRARNKMMMKNHPDLGGSEEVAKKINEAFENLSAYF